MSDEMQFEHVPVFGKTYMNTIDETENRGVPVIGEHAHDKGQHENRHCVRGRKVRAGLRSAVHMWNMRNTQEMKRRSSSILSSERRLVRWRFRHHPWR